MEGQKPLWNWRYSSNICHTKGEGYARETEKFKADERFGNSIETAIGRAPSEKMAGKDGRFIEMIKIERKILPELLIKVWNKMES